MSLSFKIRSKRLWKISEVTDISGQFNYGRGTGFGNLFAVWPSIINISDFVRYRGSRGENILSIALGEWNRKALMFNYLRRTGLLEGSGPTGEHVAGGLSEKVHHPENDRGNQGYQQDIFHRGGTGLILPEISEQFHDFPSIWHYF